MLILVELPLDFLGGIGK